MLFLNSEKFIKYISSERGIAILISSHILSEIEAMCERVIFYTKMDQL